MWCWRLCACSCLYLLRCIIPLTIFFCPVCGVFLLFSLCVCVIPVMIFFLPREQLWRYSCCILSPYLRNSSNDHHSSQCAVVAGTGRASAPLSPTPRPRRPPTRRPVGPPPRPPPTGQRPLPLTRYQHSSIRIIVSE